MIDWIVIAVYLLGIVAMGLWMGRKEDDMQDYFLGGRNIPWWAAALSLIATEISAATFLGAPEQGYLRDFTYLQFGIGSILARFVLAFLFIGVFYRLGVYTVYGFLTERFGFPTRNCAAGAFLLGRLFAGGSRVFIASLAVKVVTGFDMAMSITVLGAVAIGYTLFGGIKAVIWTDVIQAVILVLGAILCIGALVGEIPMSAGETIDYLRENDKLNFFGGGSALGNAYHWLPAIFGGFFLTMATHGTDQSMIQRLLTCKDSARGKLGMVLSGFGGIGVTVVFLVVGMLLFVIIQTRPETDALVQQAAELKASGRNGDLFLYYILDGLPAGVSGLLIAAVIAAAMSSIDSELNAMSSTFVNDFYKPYFNPEGSQEDFLRIARYATVAGGILLIVVGILISNFYLKNPDTDLLSIALGVMTLFYGALLGVFLVGLLTRGRGSNLTNIIGMSLSTLLIILINYKAKLLPALGLVDPAAPGNGFFGVFYEMKLAWPWFIVIGTGVTFAIAVLGMTAREVSRRYHAEQSA